MLINKVTIRSSHAMIVLTAAKCYFLYGYKVTKKKYNEGIYVGLF